MPILHGTWSLVLRKAQSQGAELILVAPVWKTQPWYPLLLAMLVAQPRLSHTESGPLGPQLAMWNTSGNHSAVKAFQVKLQNSFLGHGEIRQTKSHNSLFGWWNCWCSERGSDPFFGPVSDVANFLAPIHQEKYQYNSLNANRSAISSVHEIMDGALIGQHPILLDSWKEHIMHAHQSLTTLGCGKYKNILNYTESLGRSQDLELKHLTLKTEFLLAIIRPSRSADLTNPEEVKRMKVNSQRITFSLQLLSSNHVKGNQ